MTTIAISRARTLWVSLATMFGIVIIVALATFFDLPRGLRPHVYWLPWSREYKNTVLSSPRRAAEFQHAEWDGDGWGGAPVGDWMGYVIYNPSDSLPITDKHAPAKRIPGIPCDVIVSRHLEKGWYSVVTGMNQFWDDMHPSCGPLIQPDFR